MTAAVSCWNARGEAPEFRSGARRGIRGAAMIVLLAQFGAGAAAAEGMPIAPGDVLRVSIDGGPELGRDSAKVGADGRIMLPGLDTIEVAGLDLDAVRQRIETALVAREIIREPVVSVEVVSYRPFYVGGAVANPGAVPYEPGLTVRHALILAGGLDRSNGPEKLSFVDLVELTAQHGSVNFALVEVRSRMTRLQAELEEAAAPDFSGLAAQVGGAADPLAAQNPILSIDSELFRDRMTELAANQEHLQDVVALIDLEIETLAKQASLQEAEVSIQNDQLRNARTLVEQGVLPLTRLQEQEREASRLTRDLLENQSFAARAR
jgi:polysaccharide export outer membrane protein